MLQIALWKRVLIWSVCALGLLMAVPNGFYTRVETHNDAVASIEAGLVVSMKLMLVQVCLD